MSWLRDVLTSDVLHREVPLSKTVHVSIFSQALGLRALCRREVILMTVVDSCCKRPQSYVTVNDVTVQVFTIYGYSKSHLRWASWYVKSKWTVFQILDEPTKLCVVISPFPKSKHSLPKKTLLCYPKLPNMLHVRIVWLLVALQLVCVCVCVCVCNRLCKFHLHTEKPKQFFFCWWVFSTYPNSIRWPLK